MLAGTAGTYISRKKKQNDFLFCFGVRFTYRNVYYKDFIINNSCELKKVQVHKITPATDKERVDLEIKDYVVLQKPQEQADRLPPPRTLILDFTMTHPRTADHT